MNGRSIGRCVVAMLLGYGMIVVATSLGFNVWLGGANLFRGGPLLLVQGTVVAVVAGLVGGFLAAWIGGARPMLAAALVLVPLVVDSSYVILWYEGPAKNPFWYDVMGSTTLMASTLAGGWLRVVMRKPRSVPAARSV